MPFLKERAYLNADRSKAVAADSPDAAYLLGLPGDEISDEDAKKYGAKVTAKPHEADESAESGPRFPLKADAIAHAESLGLDTGGTKAEIEARIAEHEAKPDGEAE